MTLEFMITALIIVATPGTGALYTIATGLCEGPRRSVIAAFGCTLGIVPHMAAALTGLAAVLHGSPMAFNLLKLCGVAYLSYMAYGLIVSRASAPAATDAGNGLTGMAIVIKAILINLLNPKLSLFFLAFLPQFIDAAAPDALGLMIEASLVFMALTFVVFALYGISAASIRSRVIARPAIATWINRTLGIALLAMATKLAMEQR
ncbi:LysE family translocator [Rhizobium sp. C1]|uniref:LysE family translocator n=1 Tax=Rhizobium sp. C1 TaxID=1349799 RepID=UPI001E36BBFC|nr:LysE family translocator [Rhizobium sp. C1]MCD2176350.1 LysE family translocator [Rhizobium sp. C1]